MPARIRKAVLQQNFLFRELDDSAIEKISELSVRHACDKGELIFAQGDPGDALYSIVTGQIRISASSPDGKEVFLNVLEPGDTFGEIALIDGKPRSASATASTSAELIVLARKRFLDLMEREPKIAIHLLQVFCERVRWTSGLIEEAALLSVRGRIAKRLLVLAERHGIETAGGRELAISQGELAQFLSISRQIVNQYLQEWRGKKLVSLSRGKITVCDPNGLEAIATQSAAD